jgi:hypothetical protein
MSTEILARDELKRLRDTVVQSVDSQELCWNCQRICECDEWLVNEAVLLWLCPECFFEAWQRLESVAMSPVTLSAAA